jgi:hypothetical protein
MVTAEIPTLEQAMIAAEHDARAADASLARLREELDTAEAAVLLAGDASDARRARDALRRQVERAQASLDASQRAAGGLRRRLEAARQLEIVRQREEAARDLQRQRRTLAELCDRATVEYEALLQTVGAIVTAGEAHTIAEGQVAEADRIISGRQRSIGAFRLHPGLTGLTEAAVAWLRECAAQNRALLGEEAS